MIKYFLESRIIAMDTKGTPLAEWSELAPGVLFSKFEAEKFVRESVSVEDIQGGEQLRLRRHPNYGFEIILLT